MENIIGKILVMVILGSAVIWLIFSSKKSVTICSAFYVGSFSEMECTGGINGEHTFASLYKNGWTYAGDISGTNGKFMLVFEK